MSHQLVSIVVPCYNHAAYVVGCLDSIATDPYSAKELIIIDDGSTDASVKVIESWIADNNEKLPITFVKKSNGGVVSALNEGIALARGDFIAPLASDDALLPGGLEARVEYLDTHPGCLAVFGDCEVMDALGNTLQRSGLFDLHSASRERLLDPDMLAEEIICQWSVPGPVLMFHKTLISRIGGYDPRRRVEDWDFYLRMAAADVLGFCDRPVARYRVHAENSCRNEGRERQVHLELLRTAIANRNLFSGERRRLLRRKILIYAWLLLNSYF